LICRHFHRNRAKNRVTAAIRRSFARPARAHYTLGF
jgi:hypothetical protein